MTEADCVNQHLQMMYHKRTRCENWVASIALQKEIDSKEKRAKHDEFNYFDEFSEISFSDDSVRRRVRKTVNHRKSSLDLACEWRDCDFLCENTRLTFTEHVTNHVTDVEFVEKMDNTNCYQCVWEGCYFECCNNSEMKRHICYHAYHTILKAAAVELHNSWNFHSCKLDSENRNLLPDLSSPFECNAINCNYITDYFYTYLDHVNTHVNELDFNKKNNKVIPCFWKGCTFTCQKKISLKLHVKTHTSEKTLACPNCGAMFATNTKYMDHCTRKIPSKDECNRCQYCFRYFSNERLLRDHMRYHVNSHKCSFCEITCSTPAVLANHVRHKHLTERPFKCNECTFTSVKLEDFNEHMSSHDVEPKFQCQADGCTFTCRAVMSFKRHFKIVHLIEEAPVYCCHLCDRKYNRGTLLGNHLLKVHKLERPPGHSRFRYMEGVDGNYRLQVERYESLELNNANIGVAATVDPKYNFVLKRETENSDSTEKFTIYYDENVDNAGTLIAIDEMDEQGRVIRSSTVREEISNSNDCIFVDVENATQIENTANDERNNVLVRSNENGNVNGTSSHESCPKNVELPGGDDVKQYIRVSKPRSNLKKVLVDSDCNSSEILIYSEK